MRIVYVGTHYNERDIALRDVHPDEIVLLVDMDRCIACGACRLACQAEHGDAPEAPARRIGLKARNGRPSMLLALPTSCETCAAPCGYQDVRFWMFCPAPQAREYAGPFCDHCASRVSRGFVPVCATRCSMKCLHVGRAADIRFALEEKRLRGMGEAEFGE